MQNLFGEEGVCQNCRNYIDQAYNYLYCRAHKQAIEDKIVINGCELYLSYKCKSQKRILENDKKVSDCDALECDEY